MKFKGRSLYNLLQISVADDPSVQAEPWQVLDYRSLSQEALFKKLASLDIHLDHATFLEYGGEAETPEELAEQLWHGEEEDKGEQETYLLIFELWRRLLPEKETLSIFFDALDATIAGFDAGEDLSEEKTLEQLYELEDILDQAVKEGLSPKEIFPFLAEYTAHDLEGFLYDYIVELLEEGMEEIGTKLIDAFYPYIKDEKWFRLLHIRSISFQDEQRATDLMQKLLEEVEGELDFAFLREVCSLLAYKGSANLFFLKVKQALSFAKVAKDLQDVLEMMAAFYRCLDLEEMEKKVLLKLKQQASVPEDGLISSKDRAEVESFLMAKLS